MAYPTEATVDAALDSLILIVKEDKTKVDSKKLYRKIVELIKLIEKVEPTTYANLWADGSYTSDFDAA